VTATGSKLWRMVYHFDKKEKLLSSGQYPAVSLKDARERRECGQNHGLTLGLHTLQRITFDYSE
jgi:hypothetical protein